MTIITLTTDFGTGSPYVAEMKGSILSINPSATIVDITHSIEPQSIQQAAFVLCQSISTFPANSIHVAVVDPGVGTQRKIIAAEIGPWHFVGPDNGVASMAAHKFDRGETVELADPRFWRDRISHTFHGRDIMAPVAAHLSTGVNLNQLGATCQSITELALPRPRNEAGKFQGEVVWIDDFGNAVTNFDFEALNELDFDQAVITFGDKSISKIHRTFADRDIGELVAYFGSSGYLELAIVNGDLADHCNVQVGETVRVS